MGLRDKYAKKIEEQGFRPLELNEENVQVIFNRCLAKDGTPDDQCFGSILFSRIKGYGLDMERRVVFDKKKVIDNKQHIQYLYGQLKNIHMQDRNLQINDAFLTYSGKKWTVSRGTLLEFLYLGAINDERPLMIPFDSKNNSTFLNMQALKPTLSPKDPNFPAWWEAHRAEWET